MVVFGTMRPSTLALLAATTIAVVSFAAEPTPDEPALRILRQQARWTALTGATELGDASDSVFVVSGELRNVGRRPVDSVKLVYELLDELHSVVASEYGYNRSAEDLRRPDYEAGQVGRDALEVRPIAPGETDPFRMVFFRSEVPPFVRWRVRVIEVKYVQDWKR